MAEGTGLALAVLLVSNARAAEVDGFGATNLLHAGSKRRAVNAITIPNLPMDVNGIMEEPKRAEEGRYSCNGCRDKLNLYNAITQLVHYKFHSQ